MADRRTNSLTPYPGVCGFFISVKFATSLLASLAGGQLQLQKILQYVNKCTYDLKVIFIYQFLILWLLFFFGLREKLVKSHLICILSVKFGH